MFDDFFERHNGESFMLYDKSEENKEWSKPRRKYEQRYMSYHFHDNNFPKVIEKFIHGFERVHYLRKPIKDVYAGWSWFTWHRSVAEFVLTYLDKHPDYLNRFHSTSCCDELIFHTLLHPYLKQLNINPNNALRYVDWHPIRPYEGGLPLTLDERDYDSIINSDSLFCRKVDEEHSDKLLDMLDNISYKDY